MGNISVLRALLITVACVGADVPKDDDKIVGGIRTGLIPFMISVQRSGRHYCGGTLLTFYLTLTACHCLGELQYPANGNTTAMLLVKHPTSIYLLQAGDWVLYLNSKRSQRRDAKEFYIHPSCSKVGGILMYDFALIEVVDAFDRSEYVRPLRLNLDKGFYTRRMRKIKNENRVCWVIGWGKKDVDPEAPHINQFLKKAKMRFIHDVECQRLLGSQNHAFNTYNFSGNGQVCAVGVNWKESDCTGDSGGPVWCKDSIMAVVSYGFECGRGDRPAVYAMIEHFVDWYTMETPQIRVRQASLGSTDRLNLFLMLHSILVTFLMKTLPIKLV